MIGRACANDGDDVGASRPHPRQRNVRCSSPNSASHRLYRCGDPDVAELLRAIDGVTPKVLTQQLRELERPGMIGLTIEGPLAVLCEWAERYPQETAAR